MVFFSSVFAASPHVGEGAPQGWGAPPLQPPQTLPASSSAFEALMLSMQRLLETTQRVPRHSDGAADVLQQLQQLQQQQRQHAEMQLKELLLQYQRQAHQHQQQQQQQNVCLAELSERLRSIRSMLQSAPPQEQRQQQQQQEERCLTLDEKIEQLVQGRVLQQMVSPLSPPDCCSITSRFRLRNHISMTEDLLRVGSYQRALREVYGDRFSRGEAACKRGEGGGPMVIEIGAGPFALLSINAAREGAPRVVAFEAEKRSCSSACSFVRGLGFQDQVQLVRAYSTDLTPPQFRRLLRKQQQHQNPRSSSSTSAAAAAAVEEEECEDLSNVLLLHEIIGDFAGNEGAADVVLHAQQLLRLLQLQQGIARPRLPRSIPVAARTFLRPCCFPTAAQLPFPHSLFCQRSRVSPNRRLLQAVGLLQQPLLLARSAAAVTVLQGSTADPRVYQLQHQFQQQQQQHEQEGTRGSMRPLSALSKETAAAAAAAEGKGDGVRPVFEELLFEEPLEQQQQQRRLLQFEIERDGLLAGLCITNEVEVAPGLAMGTECCSSSFTEDAAAAASVSGTSCWFKGIVLLREELPVKTGDSLFVTTFADLQNFGLRTGKSRSASVQKQTRAGKVQETSSSSTSSTSNRSSSSSSSSKSSSSNSSSSSTGPVEETEYLMGGLQRKRRIKAFSEETHEDLSAQAAATASVSSSSSSRDTDAHTVASSGTRVYSSRVPAAIGPRRSSRQRRAAAATADQAETPEASQAACSNSSSSKRPAKRRESSDSSSTHCGSNSSSSSPVSSPASVFAVEPKPPGDPQPRSSSRKVGSSSSSNENEWCTSIEPLQQKRRRRGSPRQPRAGDKGFLEAANRPPQQGLKAADAAAAAAAAPPPPLPPAASAAAAAAGADQQEVAEAIKALELQLQERRRHSRPRYIFHIKVFRGSLLLREEEVDLPIEEQCPDAPPESSSSNSSYRQ